MSLIAWYKLDGNALDSSGNNRNLTTNTATPTTAGKIGGCYTFASGNAISATSGINLPHNVSFTAWAYNSNAFAGNLMIFSCNSTLYSGPDLYFTGTIAWNTGDGAGNPFKKNGVNVVYPSSNAWHHYAVVNNQELNKAFLYIDGEYYGEAVYRNTFQENRGFTIGNYTPGSTDYAWAGMIDDVRIYNHLLTEKEIRELAKAKILHYTFDEFQEPTENIASESFGFATMGDGGISYSFVGIEDGWRKYSITGTGSSSTYPYTFNINPSTILLSQRTSFSWKYKTNVESKFVNWGYFAMVNISYAPGIGSKNVVVGDYRDCAYLNVSPASGVEIQSQSIYFGSRPVEGAIFNSSTDFLYFKDVQAERKPYATPFVNGTRTGSVSDNSGYDNHADLALATTPQWVEDSRIGKGAYYFNGTKELVTNKLFFDNVNQEWTATGWVKLDVNNTYQQFNNFNLGNRIIHSSLKALLYANGGVNDHYVYSASTIPTSQWVHIAFVYRTSDRTCKFYLNGNLDASSGNYDSTDVPSGFSATTIFGTSLQGYMDDVRIYATALSADDIKELYQTRAQIDDRGNVYSNQINEYGLIQGNNRIFYKNMVSGDYSSSNYSVAGDIAGHSMTFNTNGNFKTYIGGYSNPYGDIDKIINYYVPTTHYVQYAHPTPYYYFTVDPSKTYRYTQWIYRHAEPSSSYSQNCYLGIQGNTVCNNNTTTLNSNPYFTSPAMNDSAYMDKWVLQEFYIFPYGSTGNPTSGKLNYTNGTSINNGGNYNWASGITSSHIRQYPMYEYGEIAAGSYVMHYRPRLDIVDGTEPSIAELVSCGEHVQLIEEDGSNITEKKGIDISGVFNQQIFSEIGPTNGLVAYYPLNGDAKDYANANDGTVNGAIISTGINGKACYSFDGVDDSINCGDFIDYSNGFTLSSWINPDTYGTSNYGRIVDKTINTGTSTGFFLYMPTAPTLQFMVNNIGGITASANSTPYGSWTHIIAQVDSAGNCKIYINGALNVSGTTGPPSGITATTPLTIGNRSGATDRAFDGKIQNVRIYNRALSPEEISILYDLEKGDTIKVKMDKNTLYVDGEVNEAL